MTSGRVLKSELIGLRVRIIMSSHPDLIGIEGTIVDETKNTVIVRTSRGDKRIPKHTSVFLISFPDGNQVKIDGDKIVGRLEDRIRKAG